MLSDHCQDEPTIMHLDLNSCFASCEQQANPLLRGKPIAVAAYTTPSGCILSPSIEAKIYGVKVGMRVRDGQKLCPLLRVLPPDPEKYRFVNEKLWQLLSPYTADLKIKSIDEMVLNLKNAPCLPKKSIIDIAWEIKNRIRQEIGNWLKVSIGISTNHFLAKTASNLHKPDGLDLIDKNNITQVLKQLSLEDLCGIKKNNAARLHTVGIFTPLDFYYASPQRLISGFSSVSGYYWHRRLHGFEIDDFFSEQKSYGQSYALPKFITSNEELKKLLCKLVVKMGKRLRDDGMKARGIHLGCLFSDATYWHHGKTLAQAICSDLELYQESVKILLERPLKLVKNLSVSCFNLENRSSEQLSFLHDSSASLTNAIDKINHKWGDFTLTPALMLDMEEKIIDRIAFGRL
ncbi:DNA polymerase IV [Candidatus Gottesmanbacteria bacterium]|nr:DNA polymerase IV [Candidatus Gottesmanbacteria bacterium]